MPQYTWYRDTESGICTHIDCDSDRSAREIAGHLNASSIGCFTNSRRVEFRNNPLFMEVIRVSERLLGKRLISG